MLLCDVCLCFQHGYLSDPPNVDILEVEFATDEKEDLRREMIEGLTGNTDIETFVVVPDGVWAFRSVFLSIIAKTFISHICVYGAAAC